MEISFLKINIHLFFFVLLVFTFNSLKSQESYLKHFTVNDGLSSIEVYDIIQDANGYMWFATDRGICRYNGYYFEKFGTQDGLTDNTVLRFFPQEGGNIWCSTFNKKLFYFHPKNYLFKTYSYNSIVSDISNIAVVNSLFVQKNKTLNVGFINQLGYLSINSSGTILNSSKDVDPNSRSSNKIVQINLNDNKIFSFLTTKEANIKGELSSFKNSTVISSNYQFYRASSNKDVVAFIDDREVIIVNGIDTIRLDVGLSPIGLGVYDDEHFWVGYNHGGTKIVDLNGEVSNSLLAGLSVSKVYKDHENGVWVSTLSSGVFYFQNNDIYTFSFKDEEKMGISSLTSDHNGNLYVGCYNGNILKIGDNKSELLYQSTLKKPALVQYDKPNHALYTFSDQTLKYSDSLTSSVLIKSTSLLSFSEKLDDELLIGGYGGLFTINKGTVENEFLGIRVYGIAKTKDAYYIASLKGLYKYENKILKNLSMENELLVSRCNDVDAINNTLYISSMREGLIIYNEDTIFNIGTKNGLYSDIVNEVTIENDSTIWVCTSAGLNRIKFTKNYKYNISGVSYSDGLINNEITDVEIIDNIVWVGTREGLSSFSLSLFEKKNNQFERFLTIKQIKINDKIVSVKSVNDLSYVQNRLEISYQAVSFKNRGKLNYRFRLKGLEKKWNYTENLQIQYPSLPPGAYIFIIQVRGTHDNWQDNELLIPINISKPFYKRVWFIFLVVLGFGVLVYSFFKIRILTYNRDITRELLRHVLKRLKRKTAYFTIKEQGQEIKIDSSSILYVKSSGNYLEIYTEKKKYLIRLKIGDFLSNVPDPIEYLRIRRSYIVRIDKIDQKSKKEVVIRSKKIIIGETYLHQLDKIQF